MKKQAPAFKRYIHKFTNGVWVIFDRIEYENCEVCRTEKEAIHKLKGSI